MFRLQNLCGLSCIHFAVCFTVYGRFPDGYFPPGWFFSRKDVSRKVVSRMVIFPDRTFPGNTIPGWSLSRKNVSRVVIFPDETFHGKTSWMVGLMFNCSWRYSLIERLYCVYLNGFTVNSPYCQFAPLTTSSQVNMGRVGIQCYQVPVVLILNNGHCFDLVDLVSVGRVGCPHCNK